MSLAQQNVPAPAKAFATAPEIGYDSVPNFLKLRTGVYLGEGIGAASNSKGHVFVYTRGGDTSHLYEFDPNGSFVREIGKGLYGFHGYAVRVDPSDNIWVVDEGTDMVVSYCGMAGGRRRFWAEGPSSTAAYELMITSSNTSPPPAQPYRFGRPTDVAWGRGRQHIHFRRIYKFARGEVRQERAVYQFHRHQRDRTRPVRYAAFHSDGRERQRVCSGSRESPNSSFGQ